MFFAIQNLVDIFKVADFGDIALFDTESSSWSLAGSSDSPIVRTDGFLCLKSP